MTQKTGKENRRENQERNRFTDKRFPDKHFMEPIMMQSTIYMGISTARLVIILLYEEMRSSYVGARIRSHVQSLIY